MWNAESHPPGSVLVAVVSVASPSGTDCCLQIVIVRYPDGEHAVEVLEEIS